MTGGSVDKQISADVHYSKPAVNRFVRQVADEVDREPVDADVEASGDGLAVVDGEDGRKLRDNLLTRQIEEAVLNAGVDRTIAAQTHPTKPEVVRSEVAAEYPSYLTLDRSQLHPAALEGPEAGQDLHGRGRHGRPGNAGRPLPHRGKGRKPCLARAGIRLGRQPCRARRSRPAPKTRSRRAGWRSSKAPASTAPKRPNRSAPPPRTDACGWRSRTSKNSTTRSKSVLRSSSARCAKRLRERPADRHGEPAEHRLGRLARRLRPRPDAARPRRAHAPRLRRRPRPVHEWAEEARPRARRRPPPRRPPLRRRRSPPPTRRRRPSPASWPRSAASSTSSSAPSGSAEPGRPRLQPEARAEAAEGAERRAGAAACWSGSRRTRRWSCATGRCSSSPTPAGCAARRSSTSTSTRSTSRPSGSGCSARARRNGCCRSASPPSGRSSATWGEGRRCSPATARAGAVPLQERPPPLQLRRHPAPRSLGPRGGPGRRCLAAQPSAQFRHPSARRRGGSAYDPGAARPLLDLDHPGLHAGRCGPAARRLRGHPSARDESKEPVPDRRISRKRAWKLA